MGQVAPLVLDRSREVDLLSSEAAAISFSLGLFGQATSFRDVLLDHLARASEHSQALIEDMLAPLQEYEETRSTTLATTLRTYYETRFSLSRSAKLLHVHSNTVKYRLQRIHELTGLDPASPDDLLLLSLGLKMAQFDSPEH